MRLVSHGQGLHRESLGKVGVESVGEVGRSRGDEHVVDVPVLRHELVGLDATAEARLRLRRGEATALRDRTMKNLDQYVGVVLVAEEDNRGDILLAGVRQIEHDLGLVLLVARLAEEGVEGEAEDGLTLAGKVVLEVIVERGKVVLEVIVERARDVGLEGVVRGQLVVDDGVWLRDLRRKSWRRRQRQQRREREER